MDGGGDQKMILIHKNEKKKYFYSLNPVDQQPNGLAVSTEVC